MEKLGINGIQLVAQIVNVGILLVVLKKFLYRPLLHILEKRRELAVELEQRGQEMEQRLADLEKKEKDLTRRAKLAADEAVRNALRDAKKMAATMLQEAEQKAQKRREQIVKAAEADAARMKGEMDRVVVERAVSLANTALQSLLSEKTREQLTERQVAKLLKS